MRPRAAHPLAQGLAGRLEGQRRPRNVLGRQPLQAIVLVARRERAAHDGGPVDDDHRRARVRVDVEQPGEVHLQARLLERLAHRGVGHGLAEVHEAAGVRPQTVAGIDRAAGQQDPPVLLGDGGGRPPSGSGRRRSDSPSTPPARADRAAPAARASGRSAQRAEADRRSARGRDGRDLRTRVECSITGSRAP